MILPLTSRFIARNRSPEAEDAIPVQKLTPVGPESCLNTKLIGVVVLTEVVVVIVVGGGVELATANEVEGGSVGA